MQVTLGVCIVMADYMGPHPDINRPKATTPDRNTLKPPQQESVPPTNQPKPTTAARNPRKIPFYPRIRNLKNIKFTNEEHEILNYGLQCNVEKHVESYI
jgi:hypothetical protein